MSYNNETNQYFYHSDHLGSASFISDATGYATQHLQYLPYGETFVDQHGAFDSRYTFSAKEKDDETGYSYFGARYYDSDLSVWLSVDPMAGKYPDLSPYQYCEWNPICYVDNNGDSTRYYHNGRLIFTSHDGLRNAVVDLSHLPMTDEQVAMLTALGESKKNDPYYHSKSFNDWARSYGVKYYTDDYETFWDENNGKRNAAGAIAERGFLLMFNSMKMEMEIIENVIIEAQGNGQSANLINFQKDPNIYTGAPYADAYDADAHIHNSDGSFSNFDNSRVESGSTKQSCFYDVLVNTHSIYLMNKPGKPIILPKYKTYED